MTKIAMTGAAGRMGRRIAAVAIESERFDIVSALEMAGHEALGKDVGELAGVGTFGVNVTDALEGAVSILQGGGEIEYRATGTGRDFRRVDRYMRT